MRVLLCIALVALLATPSLAGPPKGQQPPKGKYPPKPKPWRAVTGKGERAAWPSRPRGGVLAAYTRGLAGTPLG